MVLTRFMDYLLIHFLDSLSPRYTSLANYEEYLKQKNERKSFQEKEMVYPIFYKSTFAGVDILIDRPAIYVKPRMYYENTFIVDMV